MAGPSAMPTSRSGGPRRRLSSVLMSLGGGGASIGGGSVVGGMGVATITVADGPVAVLVPSEQGVILSPVHTHRRPSSAQASAPLPGGLLSRKS